MNEAMVFGTSTRQAAAVCQIGSASTFLLQGLQGGKRGSHTPSSPSTWLGPQLQPRPTRTAVASGTFPFKGELLIWALDELDYGRLVDNCRCYFERQLASITPVCLRLREVSQYWG